MSSQHKSNDPETGSDSSTIYTALAVIGGFVFLLGLYFCCSKRNFSNKYCPCRRRETKIDFESTENSIMKKKEDRINMLENEIKKLHKEKELLMEERNKYSSLLNQFLEQKIEDIKVNLPNGEPNENQQLLLKELQELRDKIKEVDHDRICSVCFVRPREVVFLECGHFVCCESCSLSLTTCPFDKSYIFTKKKVYIA